jgi:hypothetical protein
MNGLRTRNLSDNSPAATSAMAFGAQNQLASEFDSASL